MSLSACAKETEGVIRAGMLAQMSGDNHGLARNSVLRGKHESVKWEAIGA